MTRAQRLGVVLATVSSVALGLAGTAVTAPSRTAISDITTALSRHAKVAGTAWLPDERNNRVTAYYDSGVARTDVQRLRAVAGRYGDQVELRKLAGRIERRLSGGKGIYTAGNRQCSLGFNVRRGDNYFFVTAGHCGHVGTTWYSDTSLTRRIGTVVFKSLTDDYAFGRYESTDHKGSVYQYRDRYWDVSWAGNAWIGEPVRRSGAATGARDGRVYGTNATVNLAGTPPNPARELRGLIATTACAEGGDSGGPLFNGNKAIGILLASDGPCGRGGGLSFYQPITEILADHNLSIY